MIGCKRIVVTVGERIGKLHLTYGMGASTEPVATATILLAEFKGLPASTTHILSSGAAGTMTAQGAGLQGATVRTIVLARVLTLPAAMTLAGWHRRLNTRNVLAPDFITRAVGTEQARDR